MYEMANLFARIASFNLTFIILFEHYTILNYYNQKTKYLKQTVAQSNVNFKNLEL